MATVWSIKGELLVMLRHKLCFAVPNGGATEGTLRDRRSGMLSINNFQSHPLLLVLISRKPNSGKPTGAKLVHNSIAPAIIPVIQMNRMETPWRVSLYVFRVADTLGEEEACDEVLIRVRTGRHVQIKSKKARLSSNMKVERWERTTSCKCRELKGSMSTRRWTTTWSCMPTYQSKLMAGFKSHVPRNVLSSVNYGIMQSQHVKPKSSEAPATSKSMLVSLGLRGIYGAPTKR